MLIMHKHEEEYMMQDRVFKEYEGNHWYERNASHLDAQGDDYIVDMIRYLGVKPEKVAEVGCSNGYRLEHIRREFTADCCGFDASMKAIQEGRNLYPDVEFIHSTVADIESDDVYDLVICNFVLCWIDRKTLLHSIAKIDDLVQPGGILVLGDFLPDYQQRRKYHHLPELDIYTYKQDYGNIFISSGLYKEIYRHTFNHDENRAGWAPSSQRGVCVALRKMKENEYYTLA